MKRKIYLWFGILFVSFMLVGCEELDAASSNTNTEQTSSEQSKKTSKKKKKKKNKKKSKKKKKSAKKKKAKKKSKTQSNKENMVYYNPFDKDVKSVREDCIYEYYNEYDVDRGRAFDSYFPSSKWTRKKDEDGDVYVEFVGIFPEEKDNAYEDTLIKGGYKLHMIYEEDSVLKIDLGWRLASAFLCDENDEYIYSLSDQEREGIEEYIFECYVRLTNQY